MYILNRTIKIVEIENIKPITSNEIFRCERYKGKAKSYIPKHNANTLDVTNIIHIFLFILKTLDPTRRMIHTSLNIYNSVPTKIKCFEIPETSSG